MKFHRPWVGLWTLHSVLAHDSTSLGLGLPISGGLLEDHSLHDLWSLFYISSSALFQVARSKAGH